MMMTDEKTRARIERIDTLLREFQELDDPKTKSDAAELLTALMDLHASALGRIVSSLSDAGDAGKEVLRSCGEDHEVNALLLLYGLHPVPPAERVREALEKIAPVLQSHQASVEVLATADGNVRLQLTANGNGCHSAPDQIRQLVQDTVLDAAPDLSDFEIEEITAQTRPVFVPLTGLRNRKVPADAHSGGL